MEQRARLAGRRRFLAAVVGATVSAGCGSLPPPFRPAATPTPSRPGISGQLILARGGNLFLDGLPGLAESAIHQFAKGSLAASPAISPDRSTIAYTLYAVGVTASDLGRSSLATIPSSGGQSVQISVPPGAGASFEDPSWSADGKAIFATIRTPIETNGQIRGEQTGVFRIDLDGSNKPTQILANAEGAWASPNGRNLAYLTSDGQGTTNRLWVCDISGRNPREVLRDRGFSSVRAPRFSADGQWLAFAGGGGPSQAALDRNPEARSQNPEEEARARGAFAFFQPDVAEADGIPADIWIVRPDGSELRRLTRLQEHSPIPSWSPDGRWIAFVSEMGLSVVDVAGTQAVRLKRPDGTSGLCWTS